MLIRRLAPGDEALAQNMFATMAAVFEPRVEPEAEADIPANSGGVSLDYARRLLVRQDFWALVAQNDGEVVGGLTAHALPMTRSQTTELFIYDIAVRVEHQRRGIGRGLINQLFELGTAAGIGVYFVPAENEDSHALDFYRSVGGSESAVTFFTFEH